MVTYNDVNFGIVIEQLKKGNIAKLPYWKEDVFLSLQRPNANSKMTHPYIYETSRFGKVPWVATQVEILAENWIVIETEK